VAGLMAGAPPSGSDRLVTLDHWQDPPGNRWALQHLRELISTARIRREPGRARELPRADRDVLSLPVVISGTRSTIGQILEQMHTDGFLVLPPGPHHRGALLQRPGARCAASAGVGLEIGHRGRPGAHSRRLQLRKREGARPRCGDRFDSGGFRRRIRGRKRRPGPPPAQEICQVMVTQTWIRGQAVYQQHQAPPHDGWSGMEEEG
jgi:hypothetical protein